MLKSVVFIIVFSLLFVSQAFAQVISPGADPGSRIVQAGQALQAAGEGLDFKAIEAAFKAAEDDLKSAQAELATAKIKAEAARHEAQVAKAALEDAMLAFRDAALAAKANTAAIGELDGRLHDEIALRQDRHHAVQKALSDESRERKVADGVVLEHVADEEKARRHEDAKLAKLFADLFSQVEQNAQFFHAEIAQMKDRHQKEIEALRALVEAQGAQIDQLRLVTGQ